MYQVLSVLWKNLGSQLPWPLISLLGRRARYLSQPHLGIWLLDQDPHVIRRFIWTEYSYERYPYLCCSKPDLEDMVSLEMSREAVQRVFEFLKAIVADSEEFTLYMVLLEVLEEESYEWNIDIDYRLCGVYGYLLRHVFMFDADLPLDYLIVDILVPMQRSHGAPAWLQTREILWQIYPGGRLPKERCSGDSNVYEQALQHLRHQ